MSDIEPVRVLQVELSEPLPGADAFDEHIGQNCRRAISLVRLHTQPLGMVELYLGETGLTDSEYAQQIWRALGAEITEHLRRDMLPDLTELNAEGLAYTGTPTCLREREILLANAPPVSVVVATRDRTASLAACLESLLALDYPNYEIIVVDNAPSTDATQELVWQTYGNVDKVRYVREEHPGLGGARNRGILEAQAEFVAFTDDDVAADAHWLTELVGGFNAADEVACVTGLVIASELQTPAQIVFDQLAGWRTGFSQRIFDRSENRPRSFAYPYIAGTLGCGANMAFRVSALRDIGGFDPALGVGTLTLGGEDLAVFYEIIIKGYRLVYEPGAIVYHRHPREYDALAGKAYGYGLALGAYLTKLMLDRPWRLAHLAIRIPAGLNHAATSQSQRNGNLASDYPGELRRSELKGILHGPFAYLLSRWRTRKIRQETRERFGR